MKSLAVIYSVVAVLAVVTVSVVNAALTPIKVDTSPQYGSHMMTVSELQPAQQVQFATSPQADAGGYNVNIVRVQPSLDVGGLITNATVTVQ